MFGLFEIALLCVLYLILMLAKWLAKTLRLESLLEYVISYLVQYQIIYYFGDISYAIGIGVSGNGIYDYLKDGSVNSVAIFGGLCAIILGVYVRRRTS